MRFKWNYTGSWGYWWDVDDVIIDGTLSDPLHSVSLSPNPVDGGSVTGAGVYTEGATVIINSVPETGFGFVEWSGDVIYLNDPAEESNVFDMPGNDVALTAPINCLEFTSLKSVFVSNRDFHA